MPREVIPEWVLAHRVHRVYQHRSGVQIEEKGLLGHPEFSGRQFIVFDKSNRRVGTRGSMKAALELAGIEHEGLIQATIDPDATPDEALAVEVFDRLSGVVTRLDGVVSEALILPLKQAEKALGRLILSLGARG